MSNQAIATPEYQDKIAAMDYKEANEEFSEVLRRTYSLEGTNVKEEAKLNVLLKHMQLLELLGDGQ